MKNHFPLKYSSIIPVIISALTWTNARSQPIKSCDSVYENVDERAIYKDGNDDLNNFIWKELIPVLSKSIYNIEDAPTRLLFYLTIDKNGKVVDVTFKSELPEFCKLQLKELLLKMQRWTPGKINGKPVCSKYFVPIGCLKWDE